MRISPFQVFYFIQILIPGFIHYFDPSDAVVEEQLFVEVGEVSASDQQSQRALNPIA